MRILVIEDCLDTYHLIERSLVPLETIYAPNLSEAKKILEDQLPALFLIDVDLPDGNGIDFCTYISKNPRFEKIPKIILTANADISHKLHGLYSGADDYITKPFIASELKARCDVQLRKHKKSTGFNIANMSFNIEYQCISIITESGQTKISLTPIEFKICYTLAKNKDRTLSRKDLLRMIWSQQHNTTIEAKGLDTHVSHLRKKLGPLLSQHIISIYGVGYSFKEKL